MSNAYKDENGVSTLIGVLNSDGSTIKRMVASPTTHRLKVTDGTSGSDNGPSSRALRDENDVHTAIACSTSDGKTPVALYVDSSGNLLIKST